MSDDELRAAAEWIVRETSADPDARWQGVYGARNNAVARRLLELLPPSSAGEPVTAE